MTLAAFYPWLKALHVACVVLFVGGVLSVAIFLTAAGAAKEACSSVVHRLQRWDRVVTTPAMMMSWALGLALASIGHWYAARWLQSKLVLVVALSGVHGMHSGKLRRFADGVTLTRAWTLNAVVASVFVIAVLAVMKP
jgi:uncharacterized membrane protein